MPRPSSLPSRAWAGPSPGTVTWRPSASVFRSLTIARPDSPAPKRFFAPITHWHHGPNGGQHRRFSFILKASHFGGGTLVSHCDGPNQGARCCGDRSRLPTIEPAGADTGN